MRRLESLQLLDLKISHSHCVVSWRQVSTQQGGGMEQHGFQHGWFEIHKKKSESAQYATNVAAAPHAYDADLIGLCTNQLKLETVMIREQLNNKKQ